MHEFSLCKNLLDQVLQIANDQQARHVMSVHIKLGPLSGIKAAQLQESFPLASVGTTAENARLVIEELPVRVHCRSCGADSDALPDQLTCHHCNSHDTQLLEGDGMFLTDIEVSH